MKYDEVKGLIANSPTIKMLRAFSAPLIISFLYQEFKQKNRIAISSYELINRLADTIELLDSNELSYLGTEETDPLALAQRYIAAWCHEDNRYLTRYPDENGEPIHELTSHTEKVFQWMDTLKKREFVGTESRFKDIYRLLRELIENSKADPKQKIAQLEAQRDELTQQIRQIKRSGKVEIFNDTQIKERFYNVNKVARELLSDFKEVEHNFKDITLEIYKKQTQVDVNKGQILGYALDATDELKDSDQGKSFYAFWQFLVADNKQDELLELIEQMYDLLRQRDIHYADNFLRKIKVYLHGAGQKVIDSNRLLADKLSRILVERDILERKRAIEVISAIKNFAMENPEKFSGKRRFISIEDLPDINLPMERPLGEKPQEATFRNQPTELGSNKFEEAELSILFDQFEMNRQELEQNIADLLKYHAQVTLSQVVEYYPIQNGLAEVITYFSIASKSKKHLINTEISEEIAWKMEGKGEEDSSRKEIRLPQLVYVR
ncbi:MAG: DUF3375 domain-containing protein [Chitinophagales bacterium]